MNSPPPRLNSRLIVATHNHDNPDHEEPSREETASPMLVRQNIASETQVNLKFSIKFNILTIIVALAKISASSIILFAEGSICIGTKQSWIISMMCYDLFAACVGIMTIKFMLALNRVIARHESTLNFNSNENSPIRQPSSSGSHRTDPSPGLTEDEREYDVELDHRYNRVARLSPQVAKQRKLLTKLKKFSNNIYYIIFIAGQVIFLIFSNPTCNTTAVNNLMYVYILMGYLWILSPLFLVAAGCLCLPLLLLCLYFFGRGNQTPASRTDISKLTVKTYTEDMPGNKECVICMLNYNEGDRIIQLNCSELHFFHEDCLKRWLKINGQCPVCRARIDHTASVPAQHEISLQDANSLDLSINS